MLDANRIRYVVLCGLITRAESTLAKKPVESELNENVLVLEALLAQLYEERRVGLENIMQAPFGSAAEGGV